MKEVLTPGQIEINRSSAYPKVKSNNIFTPNYNEFSP